MSDEPFNRRLSTESKTGSLNITWKKAYHVNTYEFEIRFIIYFVLFWIVDESFNSQLSAFSKMGSLNMDDKLPLHLVKAF